MMARWMLLFSKMLRTLEEDEKWRAVQEDTHFLIVFTPTARSSVKKTKSWSLGSFAETE